MYHSCIFCSADLGSNESIEQFPVGRGLAFDAARGRLWAVCPRCARWNLAPLEERWEAVEAAERLFRDARIRVHGENVGLAKLPDGTRLVRVGDALPVEQAVWRYGRGLRRRRLRAQLTAYAEFGVRAAQLLALLTPAVTVVGMVPALQQIRKHRRADHLAWRLDAADSPTGQALHLRWRDLSAVRLGADAGGALQLEAWHWREMPAAPGGPVLITGAAAVSLLGKALVRINRAGADDRSLAEAVRAVEAAGGPEMMLRGMGTTRYGLAAPDVEPGEIIPPLSALLRGMGLRAPPPVHPPAPHLVALFANRRSSLALEIALHEETERRAMAGELAMLEAMWRDAEEIAAIADRLPELPPPRPPRI
jgi:hypothetical protein